MGKKQGQAQRTKGNIQPSSSAKAAELLEQANFSNFGTDLSSNLAAGLTFLEDALDMNMENDFRLVFRKISKKDALTKQKGLEELKSLIETKSTEDCVSVIPYWSKQYTKLSIDNDRKIRETCQLTHEKFCLKVNKNLAPHLKTIMPYWVLAQCDPYVSSSSKAQAAFKSVFSDTKQPEVINFTKNEILNVIYENLIVETVNSLSDAKSTNEDEAIQKYETVISMSFNALNFLFSYLNEQTINESSDRLEKLFNDQKFWRFSREKSTKIKTSFYQLLKMLIHRLPSDLNERFKVKMIPLVFYAGDEDDYSASTIIWEIILDCILNYQECWTLVNIKKAFLPKLYSILRRNASNMNREAMYSAILPFMKNIASTVVDYKQFSSEILAKMNEGVKESQTKLNNPSLNKQLECYFDCLKYILTKYATSDVEFAQSVIDNYVFTLVIDYFESTDMLPSYIVVFNNQIQSFVTFLNASQDSVNSNFWQKITSLIFKDDFNQERLEKLLNSFISLFKTQNLDKVKYLEDLVLKLCKSLFEQSSKESHLVKSLSKLVIYFMNKNLLNAFVDEEEASTDRKLELFNTKLQNLLEESKHNTEVYFDLINLLLVVNLKLNLNVTDLFMNFTKNSQDFYNFINFMFLNQNSLLLAPSSSVSAIKTGFLNILFNSELAYSYIIDEYFKKLNLFYVNMTSKEETGLELAAINSLIKYLVDFNSETKTEKSTALLSSLGDEILSNLKKVLQLVLTDSEKVGYTKLVKKFLNFSSGFFKYRLNLEQLWSFMFDMVTLEIHSSDTELTTSVQDVNSSCVKLLNTTNCTELNEYVRLNLNSGKCELVETVIKLFDYLVAASAQFKANLQEFVKSLLKSQLNNKDMYDRLCVAYLPSAYLRAYTENDSVLLLFTDGDSLIKHADVKYDANETMSLLKQLKFVLKLTNRYNIQSESSRDFYYLVSSCLVLRYFNFYTRNDLSYLEEIERELQTLVCSHAVKHIDENNSELYLLFLSHVLSVYKNNSKIDAIKQLYGELKSTNTADTLFEQHLFKHLFYDYNYLTSVDYKFESEIAFFEELHAKLFSLSTDIDQHLKEFVFSLNLLIKYTQLMLDSSDLLNLKDILVPTLGKVLDLIVDLKISDRLSGETWLKVCLNDKLNRFLKLYFTQTSKLESQQLSAHLTSKQWDFISIYLAKAAQMHTKSDLSLNQSTQLLFTSFYDLLFHYIKCMQINVEELYNVYPKNLSSEWNGFFSKEIFDPLLTYFVKLSNRLTESTCLSFLQLNAISKLSATISLVPAVRLNFNTLEVNLNPSDYSVLNNPSQKATFNLNEKLQTSLNTLYPLLTHPYRQIQMSAYLILDKLMAEMSNYYKVNETEDTEESNSKEDETNILKLLPSVIQQSLFDNIKLVSTVKDEFHFEDSLIDDHDELSNSHLISYLYSSKLMLNVLSTSSNLEFKVKLISDLRKHRFDDYLINCLFRLMPKNPVLNNVNLFDYTARNALCNDEWNLLTDTNVQFNDFYVQKCSCDLYKHALKLIPALARDWWNSQGKRIADYVDRFTSKFVSPVLIANEVKQINANNINKEVSAPIITTANVDDEYESVIKIKGMEKTREIITVYKVKDLTMELVLRLPYNYPLGGIDVSCTKRLGVSENEWRNWLLQLTTYLTHQNGDIVESLKTWKKNVDKKFNGVEECTICYSVIHGTNYQLPKMKCRTCKKKFHSSCLYKWFESSNNSTCPLCRNLF